MSNEKKNNLIPKPIFSLLFLSGLVSCSSYHRPESIQEKMVRFTPRNINPNIVPHLSIANINQRNQSSRAPASVEVSQDIEHKSKDSLTTDPKEDVSPQLNEHSLSHKRLYFMGLYQQFRALGIYISQDDRLPEIKHCPSFHTTLLSAKGTNREKYQETKSSINFEKRYSNISEQEINYYPELSLPMRVDAPLPTLGQVITLNKDLDKELAFQQALKVHLTKTYKELEQLCDTGVSSNYYNYENLARHIKDNSSLYQSGKGSLQTLVKTTIFSNMALIQSLDSPIQSTDRRARRAPASASGPRTQNPYQDHMIKELNIDWTKSYLRDVMSKR